MLANRVGSASWWSRYARNASSTHSKLCRRMQDWHLKAGFVNRVGLQSAAGGIVHVFSVEGTVLNRCGYIHVFQHQVGIPTVMCLVGGIVNVYDQTVFIDDTNQLSAVYLTTEIDRDLYWPQTSTKARRRLTNLTRQCIK